jgi:prophage regulatory protein
MDRLSQQTTKSAPASLGAATEATVKPDDAIFLRLPKVKALTGLSKSSLYDLIRAESFPAPIHLGPRTVAWVSAEVKQWAADRISTSRATLPHLGVRRMPQRALGQSWSPSKKYA